MTGRSASKKRVLAVSSGGGHWVQMMRLSHILKEHNVTFVTVSEAYQCDVEGRKLLTIIDATAWNKFKLIYQACQVLVILLRENPDVVISTGAAPGYFALRLGKMLGAKTVWIDSIANVDSMSRSGKQVGKYADLWLTQWPHLACKPGPVCKGAVL